MHRRMISSRPMFRYLLRGPGLPPIDRRGPLPRLGRGLPSRPRSWGSLCPSQYCSCPRQWVPFPVPHPHVPLGIDPPGRFHRGPVAGPCGRARLSRVRGGERLTPHRRAAGIATNSVRPCLSGPTTGAGEDQLSFGSSAPRRPVGLCLRLRGLTQPHRRAARAGPWWVARLGAGHVRRYGQLFSFRHRRVAARRNRRSIYDDGCREAPAPRCAGHVASDHAARAVRPTPGHAVATGHGRCRGCWVLAPRTIRTRRSACSSHRRAVTALGFSSCRAVDNVDRCASRRRAGALGDAMARARGSRVTRRPPQTALAACHPLLAFAAASRDKLPPAVSHL